MLVAITKEKQFILAHKNLHKEDVYYCPACKTRVYLKVGQVLRPHFAHYSKKTCKVFSEGETVEHINGKLDLFNFLKKINYQVQLEAYLPQIKQRPDLLIEYQNQKVALEFQCSSIPIEKIIERSVGYQNANYQVIWILGEQFHFQKKLTALQKASLYYNSLRNSAFLFNYSTKLNKLSIHHNFQINSIGNMHSETLNINIATPQIQRLPRQVDKNKTEAKSITSFVKKHEQFLQKTRYPSQEMLAFLALLYQNKDNVVTMPIELFQHVPNEWLIQTFHMNWKYQLIIWIENHLIGQVITKKTLMKWLSHAELNNKIIFLTHPNLPKKLLLKPIFEFIDYLAMKNIVKKRKDYQWSYQQPVKRYKRMEDKLFMRNTF